jgi:hypothetical protein
VFPVFCVFLVMCGVLLRCGVVVLYLRSISSEACYYVTSVDGGYLQDIANRS